MSEESVSVENDVVFWLVAKSIGKKRVMKIEEGGVKMSRKLIILVCTLCLVGIVTPAKAVGLLTNGDFEAVPAEYWDAENGWNEPSSWWVWEASPAAESVSVLPGGVGGLQYANVYTGDGSSLQLGQDISFSAGSPVAVSLMYDLPANNWAGAGITIHYKDAGWNVLDWGWATLYGGDGTGTDWVPYNSASDMFKTGNWTAAPVGTAYLTIKIEQWGWQETGSGSGYDNVVVTPEPATMLLLGLGGLVLRRRKRA